MTDVPDWVVDQVVDQLNKRSPVLVVCRGVKGGTEMAKPDLYGMPETNASKLQGDNDILRASNEALLTALQLIVDQADSDDGLTAWDGGDIARAAIAKAKGEA
jgi:hypothetical protein